MPSSTFAQLYLALQAQLQAQAPSIKWVDQDLGQLEAYTTRPTVAWPCVLIDFPAAQYSNEARLMQWVDVNISIRIGFAPFSSANSAAPDISKDDALKYYDIEEEVVKALHGFTANDAVQPLIRVSAATERREDTYRVRHLIFTTATEDDTAVVATNQTQTNLKLKT